MPTRAILLALVAAALFGLSTPAAKALVASIDPMVLAGLLYCGAGLGAAVLRRVARSFTEAERREAPLGRADWPWLAGAIVCGGLLGPGLMMLGLSRTDAATASLLLMLEGAATALMAWFLFHENFDRRIALGMVCLVAGAAVLSWTAQPTVAGLLGPILIVGACAAWGLDNNLTRKVSLADPLQIVELKGLVAGPANIVIGLIVGGAIPDVRTAVVAGIVGLFGYGVSLALYIAALRDLGTARTGAYFSTAPFFGAAAAVIALSEPMTFQLVAAGVLMAIGVWLHLTEHHEHRHVHAPLTHTHLHVHDEHHRHAHSDDQLSGEPHTHEHSHDAMAHSHPHAPDMHHQHRH
jgi:drug/metabolite transporter (DMT)-like permease